MNRLAILIIAAALCASCTTEQTPYGPAQRLDLEKAASTLGVMVGYTLPALVLR